MWRSSRAVLAVVAVVALCAAAAFFGLRRPERDPAGLPATLAWHPTPAEIAHEVASAAPSMSESARVNLFCLLFQRRYREHEMAIKAQQCRPGRLRLTCAAYMQPWDKAHLAMQLVKEARAVTGKQFDVDIVDSYIGAPQIKVAELRWNEQDHRAKVVYDDRFARERLRALPLQIVPLRTATDGLYTIGGQSD